MVEQVPPQFFRGFCSSYKKAFTMAHLKQTLFSLFTLATIAAGLGLASSPASAGFQFTPATKAGAPAAAGTAAPDNGPLMPMLAPDKVETDPLNQMPTPPLPSLPGDPTGSGDLANNPKTAPILKAPEAAPVTKYSSTFPEAIGFGSDLPLALGLRQIVPPEYAYAFDPGVNQGAKISWNGGKPWDIALNEALKPLGYSATVEGTTVHISSGAPSPLTAATPPAAPMTTVHAGADLRRVPPALTTNTPVATPAVEQSAVSGSKSMREVYVRRNNDTNDIEERAPGKPEELKSSKGVVLSPTDDREKPGFWERANPVNWVNDSDPAFSTAPAPPTADARPVARMSDNDARLAAGNTAASVSADTQVPNAPDAVADETPVPANAPIMLTRGPGDISKEALPVGPSSGSMLQQADTAPSGEVLNTGAVMKWEAKKGDSLKTVLQQWSEKAKVQLYWVPAQDYKLPKPISMTGNYTDAVADILGAYGETGSRPVGRLHPNLPNGPSVLIIEPASS
jgi:hypothetical protein